jgi:hypothetical protein
MKIIFFEFSYSPIFLLWLHLTDEFLRRIIS